MTTPTLIPRHLRQLRRAVGLAITVGGLGLLAVQGAQAVAAAPVSGLALMQPTHAGTPYLAAARGFLLPSRS